MIIRNQSTQRQAQRPNVPLWQETVTEQQCAPYIVGFCLEHFDGNDSYIVGSVRLGRARFLALLYAVLVDEAQWIVNGENVQTFHALLAARLDKELITLRNKISDDVRTWRKVMHPDKVRLSRMFDSPATTTKVSEMKEEHIRNAYYEVKKEWKKVTLPPDLKFERQYNMVELESE